jgi:hypothetical protein
MLVTIAEQAAPKKKSEEGQEVDGGKGGKQKKMIMQARVEGTPYINQLRPAGLREITTQVVLWMAEKTDKDGNEYEEPAHPPQWSVNAIIERGSWPDLRPLEGIVECPVLRPDGTILDVAGYDEETGLYYRPSQDFLPFAEHPTLEDARVAVQTIYDLM